MVVECVIVTVMTSVTIVATEILMIKNDELGKSMNADSLASNF